jgi:hypothetical protein
MRNASDIDQPAATDLVLTDEQEQAMAAIDAFMADLRRQLLTLFGLAGTGKTTLLKHVAWQYDHAALTSLTGKGASVLRGLRDKTGLDTSTIHGYFYQLLPAEKDKHGRQLLTFAPQHFGGHKAQGSEWPKVLLIDEYRVPQHRLEWLYTAITRAARSIVVVAT